MLKQVTSSLAPYHTFGTNYSARAIRFFNSLEELYDLLSEDIEPKLILGGGSNVLFRQDYPGMVMINRIQGRRIVEEDDDTVLVEVGSGTNWHDFVLWSLDQQWGGVENLSLIPGTVGAAPMQNIGAYGVELKEVFDHLEALDLSTGKTQTFYREDCQFDYRTSVFKKDYANKYCILSVAFKLTKKNHRLNYDYGAIRKVLHSWNLESKPTIRSISNAVIKIRNSKLPDPAIIGNAGSFFKNPIVELSAVQDLMDRYADMPVFPSGDDHTRKIPAAWLIERCGWKGKFFGRAQCSPNHALVLTNPGGASGEEIYQLSEAIIADVMDQFGIQLILEVNII